jgi:lipopolysaccharide export system protein LptC
MNRVITAKTDPQTARAYWTMSRGDSDRAFRAARRHSRVVRVLRIAIPLAVVAALAVVTLLTFFNPLRMLSKLPIDISDMVVSGTKITMEQPRLSGFTRDARAYELSADAAKQDLTKPDIVELNNIHAKVEMQDKTTIKLTAIIGIYDTKAETLNLQRSILLSSSTGYEGRLSEARVDIRKGHVVSDHPVEVKMLQGSLDANRLEIIDSGEVVRFHGGVHMTLMLNGTAVSDAKAGMR